MDYIYFLPRSKIILITLVGIIFIIIGRNTKLSRVLKIVILLYADLRQFIWNVK